MSTECKNICLRSLGKQIFLKYNIILDSESFLLTHWFTFNCKRDKTAWQIKTVVFPYEFETSVLKSQICTYNQSSKKYFNSSRYFQVLFFFYYIVYITQNFSNLALDYIHGAFPTHSPIRKICLQFFSDGHWGQICFTTMGIKFHNYKVLIPLVNQAYSRTKSCSTLAQLSKKHNFLHKGEKDSWCRKLGSPFPPLKFLEMQKNRIRIPKWASPDLETQNT